MGSTLSHPPLHPGRWGPSPSPLSTDGSHETSRQGQHPWGPRSREGPQHRLFLESARRWPPRQAGGRARSTGQTCEEGRGLRRREARPPGSPFSTEHTQQLEAGGTKSLLRATLTPQWRTFLQEEVGLRFLFPKRNEALQHWPKRNSSCRK